MATRLTVFDSNRFNLLLASIPIDDGRAADTFLTMAPAENYFDTVTPSADGVVIRYAKHDFRWNITLTLTAASVHNAQLSALVALDASTFNGAGVVPFVVSDIAGATVVSTAQCWIKGPSELSMGAEPGDRVWEMEALIRPANIVLSNV